MADSPPTRSFRYGLIFASAVAFSPVIVNLARSLGQVDGRLAILIAPLLATLAARRQIAPATIDVRRGILLIGAGLVLELVGLALDFWTMARLGLPVAALGIGLALGRPGPAQLALLFFVVPIPISITSLTTPWLESVYADLCVRLLHGVGGLDIQATGPLLIGPVATLELYASDSGIWLAYVLAALGWYSGLCAQRDWPAVFGRAALSSLIGWPLQLLAICVAGALVAGGNVDAARSWLDWGLHAAVTVCALLWIHRASKTEGVTGHMGS